MYHIPGITPEARDVEEAFGGRKIVRRHGSATSAAERKLAYERLNCADGSRKTSISSCWAVRTTRSTRSG